MNLLMVAYYFPPDSSSGSLRPLYFSRYFTDHGDRVHILTALPSSFLADQPRDVSLVPRDMSITRTRVFRPREGVIGLKKWFFLSRPGKKDSEFQGSGQGRGNWFQKIKDGITIALAIPDPHVGWIPSGIFWGRKLIRANGIQAIYATGSPWSALLIGVFLKLFTGCPLVVDFRDPWTRNPPFQHRPALVRKLEMAMEKFVVKYADLVVSNTRELEMDFKDRHGLSHEKVCTITNGFIPQKIKISSEKTDVFNLTHAGALYYSRNPKNLIRAILSLVERGVVNRNNFRLNLIGGISIPDPELEELLEHEKVLPLLNITPRVSLEKAFFHQSQSDVLILIQMDFPLQVPRKLYDAMAFGKPVLAITDQWGATAAIVNQGKMGQVVDNRVSAIERGIENLFRQWVQGRLPRVTPNDFQDYDNRVLCQKMREKLTTLLTGTGEGNA